MALGSTLSLTEMSTRNLPGGKGRPARKPDNLTAKSEQTVYKMWEPRRLTTLWASTACYRGTFIFLPLSFIHSFHSSMALQPFVGPWPHLQFHNLFTETVGLLGRVICLSQGGYLHTGQTKHKINAHTNIHALRGIRTHDLSV
jgi:hypothetical protein